MKAPAGAFEDCGRPALHRFNATRVGLGGAVPAGSCDLESGLLVVDLQQWALLDMTSRVEYWLALK